MANVIKHSHVHANHFEILKKRAITKKNIKKAQEKLRAMAPPVPGQTKVLNWNELGYESVVSLGDFNSTKFALDSDGKIIPVTGGNDTVVEQTLTSDLVSLNIRRLDDEICYVADGMGNRVPGQKSIEFAPGEINELLLPDEPVVVNMMTNDGESTGQMEIRPSGEVAVYTGNPNAILAQDIPMSGMTIKMDDDVIERYFETPHLKIRCRLDNQVVLQYEVEGKWSATGIAPMADDQHPYVELAAGSLGPNFTPLATGPVVALRTIDGNAGAYVQFNKDGSVKLYVPLQTNFPKGEDKTTCIYLNIVEEGVVEQIVVGANIGIIDIRKSLGTTSYSIQTAAGTSIPAGGQVTCISSGIISPELVPDETIYMPLPTIDGTWNLYAEITTDGSIYFKNPTAAAIPTVDATVPVDFFHINRQLALSWDAHEQVLENDMLTCVLRKDNNVITSTVTPKTITTPAVRQTKELFPAGTIDSELIPKYGETIVTELPTAGHTGSDAFTTITNNGQLMLTYGGPSAETIDPGVTSTGTYLDVQSTDTVLAETLLEGDYFDILCHKQGDVITYYAYTKGSVLYDQDAVFRSGSIPSNLCPDYAIILTMQCSRYATTNNPAYIVINPDGSVDVWGGTGLEPGLTTSESCIKKEAVNTKTITRTGNCLSVTATISDESIVYSVMANVETCPEGYYTEIAPENAFPVAFRPQDVILVEIPNAAYPGWSCSFIEINTDGTVYFYTDGTGFTLDHSYTSMETIMDPVYNPYIEYENYMIQWDPYASKKAGKHVFRTQVVRAGEKYEGPPEGLLDFVKIAAEKVGNLVGICPKFCVMPDDWRFPDTGGGWVNISTGPILDLPFRPMEGSTLECGVLCGATRLPAPEMKHGDSLPPDFPKIDMKAWICVRPDGSVDFKTTGEKILGDKPGFLSHVRSISEFLVEKEINLSSHVLAGPHAGVGDWLKATFRKVKDVVMGVLKGNCSISTSILGQELDLEFGADKGVRLELNPGKGKGTGRFHFEPAVIAADGTVTVPPKFNIYVDTGKVLKFEADYELPTTSNPRYGDATVWGKNFCLPHIKMSSGDIFDNTTSVTVPNACSFRGNMYERITTLALRGEHHHHQLLGEGHMYYSNEHVSEHGIKTIVSTHTVRTHVNNGRLYLYDKDGNITGVWDFLSSAADFIKSNIDLRALGSSIFQGGASIIGSLVSGKGFGDAVSGAFRDVMAGGIGQFLAPDGILGSAMGIITGSGQGGGLGGIIGGVSKFLPSGAVDVIGKGMDFIGSHVPFAGSYINKARSYLNGGQKGDEVKILCPHQFQILDGELSLRATKYDMTITYDIFGTNILNVGTYKLKGELRDALRPDNTIINWITPSLKVTIGVDGKIELDAKNREEFKGESYTINAVKEYRPYGWNFAELAKQNAKAKPKRKYNKKK